MGIGVLGQRACTSKPDCWITNLNLTEKSIPPFCEHSCIDEQGNYAVANCRRECELWQPCQARAQVQNLTAPDFLGAFIAHPQWENQWGDCDKRTSGGCNPAVQDCRLNNICHDQAVARRGPTRMMACPPGVAPGGPGCSESQYSTPLERPRGIGGHAEPGIPTRPKTFPKDRKLR